MQEGNQVDFMVASYHANATAVEANIMIDILYKLWVLSAHNQRWRSLDLFYTLAHSTSVTELARLPQYQTKEQTLHMLSYPLLMAADIIVSDADAVIVWDDQEPHMHFYREIARRNGYKEAITIKSDTPRIMSIKDPSKKMSKSLWDEHCIYLDETLGTLTEKIMKAPTTPEWVGNLKAIAKLYWFEYDESNNKESKENLIKVICNYIY
jgi:tryptophanyl-tRNA synthetase